MLKEYCLTLTSPVSQGFRSQKAANSLDIDVEKKSIHHLHVSADLSTPFNVGLIVGASGSGKTTLARHIWGETSDFSVNEQVATIEQFPLGYTYEQCAVALTSVGLTSVPCWIRPFYTLSNGQRVRAKLALKLAHDAALIIEDEWTSVVDRTVAKVMSHAIQKHLRKADRQAVLLSCHYDVIEWLNPDWIIDCNTGDYQDRRAMVGTFERTDRLRFEVAEVSKHTWNAFSRYHYLSAVLPKGRIYTYGLFHGEDQIGFVCYAAYIIGDQETFFSNRVVVHPDYVGFGLGLELVDITAQHMLDTGRAKKILAKFSSEPMYKARVKSRRWKLKRADVHIKRAPAGDTARSGRSKCLRSKVRTWTFEYVP